MSISGCLTTGIGSLPVKDPADACKIIFDAVDIPFWPQLPKRSFKELMMPQYSEAIPFVKIDDEKERIWFEIGDENKKADGIYAFYEKYTKGDPAEFAISREYAPGFYYFMEELGRAGRQYKYIKGHITGPLTFTLSIPDQNKRPIYYDADMLDTILKALSQKAVWQIRELQNYADKVIIFIDEPMLSAFGSSTYLGLTREDVIRLLNEVIGAIHSADAIAGIHCCGNTDWSIIAATDIDIINFDAYIYTKSIAIYPNELNNFLKKGGMLAWGIVPTSEAIRRESADSLYNKMTNDIKQLIAKSFSEELISRQCLVTPSCGAGSMNEDDARAVFRILKEIGGRFKKA
ncbi:MAG: methionine synthase [Nitrospirae bacterium]|nr:methionine synthase [Nitrospirota bacterium]